MAGHLHSALNPSDIHAGIEIPVTSVADPSVESFKLLLQNYLSSSSLMSHRAHTWSTKIKCNNVNNMTLTHHSEIGELPTLLPAITMSVQTANKDVMTSVVAMLNSTGSAFN